MVEVLSLYIDETGSRNPDHDARPFNPDKPNAFAIGGVIIKDEDEDEARKLYSDFCAKWEIDYPLHSTDIRNYKDKFCWLGQQGASKTQQFMGELGQLMLDMPVIGIACVIDRPGYDARYKERYDNERWKLCKTAFTITVERATKYAIAQGRKLNVFPERVNGPEDSWQQRYFDDMKAKGLPFDASASQDYQPLSAEDFRNTLYDYKTKRKSSPMAQLADLYLWPMRTSGYNQMYLPYKVLRENQKLIDCVISVDRIDTEGIKYSCFEMAWGGEAKPKALCFN